MRTYNFDTTFNHLKWAIKDKLHFEILIAVIWVSNLFQNISYSNQTTNNKQKQRKNAFKVIKSYFKEIEQNLHGNNNRRYFTLRKIIVTSYMKQVAINVLNSRWKPKCLGNPVNSKIQKKNGDLNVRINNMSYL